MVLYMHKAMKNSKCMIIDCFAVLVDEQSFEQTRDYLVEVPKQLKQVLSNGTAGMAVYMERSEGMLL
jgi:hypothetical protein